jgi:glycosyltransferase involved in cell wall biosynthesis
MLNKIEGKVQFNIYGPIEDQRYWRKCNTIIKSLPDNIEVEYCGIIDNVQVSEVMEAHSLFYFPTHGENFGHVILEALAAGCPILISDQTPWRDLESKGVGWDLPLDRPDLFNAALQKCVAMDEATLKKLSLRAKQFAEETINDPQVLEQNRSLFNIVYKN